jgi:hypothetical protein
MKNYGKRLSNGKGKPKLDTPYKDAIVDKAKVQ